MMNILLLNNNPVVTKLVTLSAQKSSDKLDIVENVDEIFSNKYDLVVIDDSLYSQENIDKLSSKVEFSKSLYICSRNAEPVDFFTTTLKKPFLPTDLVELFINFGKSVTAMASGETTEKVAKNIDSDNIINNFNLDDQSEGVRDDGFDDFDDLETSLDEEIDFNDDELAEDITNSILDKDDLREVQTLLKETEKEDNDDFELEFDDEEEIEKTKENIDDFEEELDFEDEEPEEELADEPKSMAQELEFLEDDEDEFELEFEDGVENEEVVQVDEKRAEPKEDLDLENDDEEFAEDYLSTVDETETSEDFEDLEYDEDKEDIESKIEEAMQNLSEEDLQSEIDGDILLDIDSLTSRDFKIAIGEELDEEAIADRTENDLEMDEDLSEMIENEETIEEEGGHSENDGVESLKKLLAALSNENVAASLKGMKISINITLGGK